MESLKELASLLVLAFPTLLHLGAQMTGLGQLVLLQMGGPLRPGDLGLEVSLLKMHFIQLMIRNVSAKATAAAVRVSARRLGLHAFLMASSAQVATSNLLAIRPVARWVTIGLPVALVLLLVALALQEELVLLV